MPSRELAAFDFDGTLTHRDTLVGFLSFACGRPAVTRSLVRVGPTAARARAGRLAADVHHRDAVKVALLRDLFAGREPSWLAERGEAYSRGLARRLRPDMVGRLSWHRGQGHELVIVSASLTAYLDHFGRDHGFDHVIACELEVGDDGLLTGELVGANVRGPEKAVRLKTWLGDQLETARIWAYGNSSGDDDLLAMADRPERVGRRTVMAVPAAV